MKRQVVLTLEAQDDVRRIDDWWQANRPAATRLFSEELAAALAMLEATPEIGRPYRHSVVATLRRVLLRATRYHVYYVVAGSAVRARFAVANRGCRGEPSDHGKRSGRRGAVSMTEPTLANAGGRT